MMGARDSDGFESAAIRTLNGMAVTATPSDAWIAQSAGKWTEFDIDWHF
jgi:hypothetical protein